MNDEKKYVKLSLRSTIETILILGEIIVVLVCLGWTAVHWFTHDDLTYMGIFKWQLTHQWGAYIYIIVVYLLNELKFKDDFDEWRKYRAMYKKENKTH